MRGCSQWAWFFGIYFVLCILGVLCLGDPSEPLTERERVGIAQVDAARYIANFWSNNHELPTGAELKVEMQEFRRMTAMVEPGWKFDSRLVQRRGRRVDVQISVTGTHLNIQPRTATFIEGMDPENVVWASSKSTHPSRKDASIGSPHP